MTANLEFHVKNCLWIQIEVRWSSILLKSTSWGYVQNTNAQNSLVFPWINIPVTSYNDLRTVPSDSAPNYNVGRKLNRCVDVFRLQSNANAPTNIKSAIWIELRPAFIWEDNVFPFSIDHVDLWHHSSQFLWWRNVKYGFRRAKCPNNPYFRKVLFLSSKILHYWDYSLAVQVEIFLDVWTTRHSIRLLKMLVLPHLRRSTIYYISYNYIYMYYTISKCYWLDCLNLCKNHQCSKQEQLANYFRPKDIDASRISM